MQESLLSPRVVIYAADQLMWQCRADEKFEREDFAGAAGYDINRDVRPFHPENKALLFPPPNSEHDVDKLPGVLAPMMTGKMALEAEGKEHISVKDSLENNHQISELLSCWYRIVESYGPRSITKVEDRLPAIAGIARRISALTGLSYAAGIWEEDIIQGLCWMSVNQTWTSSKYVGPTWSWVSITYLPSEKKKSLHSLLGLSHKAIAAKDIKIERIDIKLATTDPFSRVQEGSSLRIQGLCCNNNYTINEHNDMQGCRWGWDLYTTNKLQFSFPIGALDSWGSPVDRELLFLHLACTAIGSYWQEVGLLILEKSPRDSEKYVRVGIAAVPWETWSQVDLEFWSVQTITII